MDHGVAAQRAFLRTFSSLIYTYTSVQYAKVVLTQACVLLNRVEGDAADMVDYSKWGAY